MKGDLMTYTCTIRLDDGTVKTVDRYWVMQIGINWWYEGQRVEHISTQFEEIKQ